MLWSNWSGMNQVCVVGSHDCDLPLISRLVTLNLQNVPHNILICTRETEGLDTLVVAWAKAMGHNYTTYSSRQHGGAWSRDVTMVEHSDAVIAFFSPGGVMAGGTGHIVQEAIRRNKAVLALTYDGFGRPILVGSWEVDPDGSSSRSDGAVQES